jgi:hypothetical protein
MNFIYKIKVFVFCIAFFEICLPLKAGNIVPLESIKKNALILPHVYGTMETKTSVSISYVRLPEDWIETSVDAPLIQLSNKIGFPGGFTLESSLQSIYIANQFRFGPRWNVEIGKFSCAAGVDAGLLFGKMNISGFNNKASGWMMYPVVSLGYRTDQLAFTLSAERSTIQSLTLSSGSVETSDFKNFKSGQTISIYLEQRLWRNHVMILGLVNNFQKFYFPAWPAFSAFNKRYYIPQMYLGLVL